MTINYSMIEDAIRGVPALKREHVFELADELERGGRRLVVEHRKTPPELALPDRKAHVLHSVDSLVAYVKAFVPAEDRPLVVAFVDVVSKTVEVEPDETAREAGGGDVIRYEAQRHPHWVPWIGMAGKWVSLAEMVAFLREERRHIREDVRDTVLFQLAQVRAATTVELHEGSGPGASVNGLVIRTRLSGNEAAPEAVDLPEQVRLELPLFCGDESIHVDLGLELKAANGGQAIQAKLSGSDCTAAEHEAFGRSVRALAWAFPDGERINVLHGRRVLVSPEVRS